MFSYPLNYAFSAISFIIIDYRSTTEMNEIDSLLTESVDPESIFELLNVLGQGAYGSVSKVIHKETGQRYAVKILPATNNQQLTSIKKQISILRECNDEHIVKYFGCYMKDSNLWIVMEYCDAGSITDIMHVTEKNLNQHEIASILESVLKGLQYLHKRKKIHRDIKAANILLDGVGRAKLADFGVSTESRNTNDKHKTQIGSPYWMSPQVLKYSEYTHKTDIWSLGITSIELAEGSVPYSDVKPYIAMWKMRDKPTQTLSQPQKWSQQFNDFISCCLEINPSNRPEARQLLEHPFIVQKSRGQMLLAEMAINCQDQLQQYRRGSQSNDNSFDGEFIIEGGSVRNLTTISHGEAKDTTIRTERENLDSSLVIREDIYIDEDGNSSMVVNYLPDKADNSNCLSQYISKLKQNNSMESHRKQLLVSSIANADQDCIREILSVFERQRGKVLKQAAELYAIENTQEDLECNLLQKSSFNQFIKNTFLKQEFSFQEKERIRVDEIPVIKKHRGSQASRDQSNESNRKGNSVERGRVQAVNPFENEHLQEKVGLRFSAKKQISSNFSKNDSAHYGISIQQFIDDPMVKSMVLKSHPQNSINELKPLLNTALNSNVRNLREPMVNANISNMVKVQKKTYHHHQTEPTRSKEKAKATTNRFKKNKDHHYKDA